MVISLRLSTGKIRKYKTSYSGLGENPSYHTKCGLHWANQPKQEEECTHLDCALAAAEHEISGSILFLAFSFIFIVAGGSRIADLIFEVSWGILLVAFSALILAVMIWALYKSHKDKWELIEFRDKGTVGGIKAWQDWSCIGL